MSPEENPLAVLGLTALVLGVAVFLLERGRPGLQTALSRCVRTAVSALLCVAVISSVVWLLTCCRLIGGVDFFYYVCNARDMLVRPAAPPLSAYAYFPGGYAFYRSVIRCAGLDLASIQAAYATVLFANAVLTGCIVRRLTGNFGLATFGGVWYLVLCSRYEGLAGTSEAIATLPFLTGLLIWNGHRLRGRRGTVLVLLLGACLGLAVLVKQQAGLLSIGALWLLVGRQTIRDRDRHALSLILLLGVVALGTLLTGILLEGHGLTPLRRGLTLLGGYERHGSILTNLYRQVRNDESAALAVFAAGAAWLAMVAGGKWRNSADHRSFDVASFVMLSGIATLVQFSHRDYRHYFMLTAPCLVIASLVLLHAFVRIHFGGRDRRASTCVWLSSIVAFPLFYTGGPTANLHVWRLTPQPAIASLSMWHESPPIPRDLAVLRARVEPGSQLYILPPRRSVIHFLLDTHSIEPPGYGWGSVKLDQLDLSSLDALLVLHHLSAGDQEYWEQLECGPLLDRALAGGFVETDSLRAMSLYRPIEQEVSK